MSLSSLFFRKGRPTKLTSRTSIMHVIITVASLIIFNAFVVSLGSFGNVSHDILVEEIGSYLKPSTLVKLSQTSKRFCNLFINISKQNELLIYKKLLNLSQTIIESDFITHANQVLLKVDQGLHLLLQNKYL